MQGEKGHFFKRQGRIGDCCRVDIIARLLTTRSDDQDVPLQRALYSIRWKAWLIRAYCTALGEAEQVSRYFRA